MRYRNRETGRVREAEPGTVRQALFARSGRYEPVEDEQPETAGHYEGFTKAELREMAADMGMTFPDKATKAEIIARMREG